jgi:hypothetical protein
MDPYIEQPEIWGDFHNNLSSQIQAALNEIIRPNYFARLIPYVTYEVVGIGQVSRTYPDVSVFQPSGVVTERAPVGGAVTAAVIDPAPVESEVELEFPLRLHYVEIRTVVDAELVTVIEILSPVNKRPGHEAYEHYLRKRRQILQSDTVHLLEIDLLRGGKRPPLVQPVPEAPYYVMLSRASERPKVKVWPMHLADRLPVVPVPLLPPDPDVPLDLRAAVASVYERGAYDLQLNYGEAPPPPQLSESEAARVKQLLRAYRHGQQP